MDSGSAHGLYIPLYACRGKNMQVGEKKYPLLRKKDNLLLTFTVRHIIWNAKLGNNEKTLPQLFLHVLFKTPNVVGRQIG